MAGSRGVHAQFRGLAARHPNFSYHAAISDPKPQLEWNGYTGLIHAVVLEHYLEQHPAPEEIEYYLCGPPLMSAAVVEMLGSLGVDEANIRLDDFGT